MSLSPPLSADDVGKRFMTNDGRVGFILARNRVLGSNGCWTDSFYGVVTPNELGEPITLFRWRHDGSPEWPYCHEITISSRIDGWNDIESAPKDGSLVLLCDQERGVLSGFFNSDDKQYDPQPSWRDLEQVYVLNPTHWMPLPDPPGCAP